MSHAFKKENVNDVFYHSSPLYNAWGKKKKKKEQPMKMSPVILVVAVSLLISELLTMGGGVKDTNTL